MIDRSKLSPAGEKTMAEIEAQLMELCKQLTVSVQRMAKPSRREQRRARKAAKNLVMYKTTGRRPWSKPWREESHDALRGLIRTYRTHEQNVFVVNEAHSRIVYHLREPSGFMWMSRVAEEMRLTKAHTPDFVDEVVTYTEEQLKAIETWVRETWGDLKPAEIAEKLGRGEP